jgi:hypothetical protein
MQIFERLDTPETRAQEAWQQKSDEAIYERRNAAVAF